MFYYPKIIIYSVYILNAYQRLILNNLFTLIEQTHQKNVERNQIEQILTHLICISKHLLRV